jgi:PIN domain nuclease of toxin-antitoxin system
LRLLLDTHILLAVLNGRPETLRRETQRLVSAFTSEIYVSVVSFWEIAIKKRLGKLTSAFQLEAMPDLVRVLKFQILIVDEFHALAEVLPEPPTRDPFDRLLLAQCQVEGLHLITADRALVGHKLAAQPKQ